MAEKIISPGVFTQEIDASFLPTAIADIGACLIGPTVKGPAGIPTIVTSFSDFQNKFGDTFKSGSSYYQYLTSHTAEQYLKHSDTLTVVRVLAGSYGGASTTISSSVDPAIVGGGVQASASIAFTATAATVGEAYLTGSLVETSMSFGGVEFSFTASGAGKNTANSTTKLFAQLGTVTNVAKAGESASLAMKDLINNSSSLHGLPISASNTTNTLVIKYDHAGSFGSGPSGTNIGNQFGASPSGSGFNNLNPVTTSSISMSVSNGINAGSGNTALAFQGGSDFNNHTFKQVFKLHTLADGETLNSGMPGVLDSGTNSILTSGSKDNFRYEISAENINKGTFTLAIRRGDDKEKRKQVLETFTGINLDPDSPNYIAKAIGDQYNTISNDENGNPFLKLVGDYPRKSKYVRVEVLEKTSNYLDENGEIRLGYASASLPAFHSGSNSGSFAGSFSGGSDGTFNNPRAMYDSIEENNSQGLDPSNDGGSGGHDEYIQALNLISNQDEYDINLILAPGIINSVHTAVASKIIDVCEDREDCFAIIDPVIYGKNVGDATEQAETRDSNFAAMYWPWIKVPDSQIGTQRWVPPSVAVSGIYAFNDKVAHEWFAPAGLNRGTIDTAIQAERKLTNSDRDTLYDSSVNPIATFPGQGVTIFGQKTLQKKSSALDRVNVRRLLIRVKKFIAASSRFLVFEQNTAATRQRFLNIANPFLDRVKAQSGLTEFRVIMDNTNNTPDTIDRNQLVGQLFLQPARTAEFIVLDFTIQATGASFPE
jgi:hypothetical protein